jgi:uncharacterized membrane protein YjjP (DUF1212 family)
VPLDREEAVAAFLMELGRALLTYGAPTPWVEETMTAAARTLGIEAEAFATPTMLQASFGPLFRQRQRFLRLEPGGVDLSGRARVDEIAAAVLAGRTAPDEGRAALIALRRAPRLRPPWMLTLASGISAAASARFFSGGAAESAVAFVIGLGVGGLELFAEKRPWFDRLLPCAAALAASAFAVLAAYALGSLAVAVVVVSSLIVLLPGLSITTAVGELAARHLTAGTSRIALGIMTLVLMAFGVAAGRSVAGFVPRFAELELPASPPPPWTLALALAAAPAAFAVRLNAFRRDFPAVYVGGVVGFLVGRAASSQFDGTFGAFVAAVAVTLLANGWSRRTGRTAAIILTPGLLMLVPGSLGFRSLASLVRSEVVEGVEGVFNVVLIACAIVTGLFVAMQILPPREPSPTAPPPTG